MNRSSYGVTALNVWIKRGRDLTRVKESNFS